MTNKHLPRFKFHKTFLPLALDYYGTLATSRVRSAANSLVRGAIGALYTALSHLTLGITNGGYVFLRLNVLWVLRGRGLGTLKNARRHSGRTTERMNDWNGAWRVNVTVLNLSLKVQQSRSLGDCLWMTNFYTSSIVRIIKIILVEIVVRVLRWRRGRQNIGRRDLGEIISWKRSFFSTNFFDNLLLLRNIRWKRHYGSKV